MQDTLHLTLKKKWFDLIASGIKKEEYRDIKKYWNKRLINAPFSFMSNNLKDLKHDLDCCPNGFWKSYKFIEFKNGYSKNAPTITTDFKGVCFGTAVPEWSDSWQGDVFVIKIGDIIKKINV